MAKKTWSRKSKFTKEQRAAIARESLSEPDGVVAKRHDITPKSLTNWRRRAGLDKPKGRLTAEKIAQVTRKKARKATAKKAAARRLNGKSNGHAGLDFPVPGLDGVHQELSQAHQGLTRALASVDAMKQALARVFGGGA